MDDNNEKKGFSLNFSVLLGIIVVLMGAAILINRMDLPIYIPIATYWPVLLIIVGAWKLTRSNNTSGYLWSGAITVVGVLFLLNNLGKLSFGFGDLWPILIILVGFHIISGGLWGSRKCGDWGGNGTCSRGSGKGSIDDETLNIDTILSGVEYSITSKKFRGGKINVVMGSCVLDLREAEMKEPTSVIDADAVMGSVELRIPLNWELVMKGTPIMGSIENKTATPQNPTHKLIVKGSAVMSAIEVRS